MRIAICIAFLVSTTLASNVEINPFSDEFIDYINSKQNTWKAGRNFDKDTPTTEIKKLLGSRGSNPKLRINPIVHTDDIEIPESFDSRTNWPECSSVISSIADQSSCGSCWAVSAASAMSDRRCIASGGSLKVPVSAEDLMACCKNCGFGCNGGYVDAAWDYWGSDGIVTGGKFNSSEGCKPYPFQPCDHHVVGQYVQCSDLKYDTPSCTHMCSTDGLDYKSQLTFAKGSASWLSTVADIQREILQNGPVSAGFRVFSDFVNYKSDELLEYSTNKITFEIPFLSVPGNCIDETLNIFNSFDPNIQFTVEKETDNSVPFLDLKLIRTNDNKIITRWYRKPINSNRFLNFHSNHSMKIKRN